MAITVSNRPQLKDPEAAANLIDQYVFEDQLTVVAIGDTLSLYGFGWPSAGRVPEGQTRAEFLEQLNVDDCDEEGEPWIGDAGFSRFLTELRPFLRGPLIVQATENDKCRFPLVGWEWRVSPEQELTEQSLFTRE